MTNLADLIPAGGGQNNTDFVADGTVSSGAPVILTAAGKAAAISATAAAIGTQEPVDGTTYRPTGNQSGACYSVAEDTWVYSWCDSPTGGYAYAVAVSFSGSSITVGTPVAIQSQVGCTFHKCAYDPTTELIYFVWKANSGGSSDYFCRGEAWALSGTTLSDSYPSVQSLFGNQNTGNNYGGDVIAIGESKILVTWGETNGHVTGSAVQVVDLSSVLGGGSPAVGTAVAAWNQSGTKCRLASGNTNEFVFQGGNASQIAYTACTVASGSGNTTITAGTPTVYSGNSQQNDISSGYWFGYTSPASTYMAVYQDPGAATGTLVGRVITVSGTTLTMNSAASLSADPMADVAMAWGGSATDAYLYYRKNASPNNGEVTPISYSGTTVSDGTPINIGNSNRPKNAITYDRTEDKVAIAYYDANNSDASTVNFASPFSTNLTATNLLGIAAGAISDTATGTINTWGSRNEVQTGLTIGSDYYVQTDGTITTSSSGDAQLIGTAITATQINIKDYTG